MKTESEKSNEDIARKFLASVLEGNKETAVALANEDFEALVPASLGTGEPMHGIESLKQMIENMSATYKPGVEGRVLRSVACGDSVVLEVRTIAQTQKGAPYDNIYVHWFELQNARISNWRIHADTKHAFDALS